MSDDDIFDTPLDYKDRRASLIISGIILALIGFMIGGIILLYGFLFAMLGKTAGGTPELDGFLSGGLMKLLIVGASIYGSIALAFLVIGGGNIFMKRWSRPLAMIIAAAWVYGGLTSMISTMITMPKMQEYMMAQMAEEGAAPPSSMGPDAFMGIYMIIQVGSMFVFGVMLPGLIFWLNMSRDARITLEVCDPKPRWTDRCPVPILGVAVVAGAGGLMMLVSAFWMPFMPIFGKVLTGKSATIAMAGIGVVLLVIAWGAYRKQIIAWGLAVILVIAGTISAVISFPRMDWKVMYEMLGLPAEEEEFAEMVDLTNAIYSGNSMTIAMILAMLPLLAYLIWVLRFFKGKPEEEVASPAPG